MLPGEAELVLEWKGLPGEEKCKAPWAVQRTGFMRYINNIPLPFYKAGINTRGNTEFNEDPLKFETPQGIIPRDIVMPVYNENQSQQQASF